MHKRPPAIRNINYVEQGTTRIRGAVRAEFWKIYYGFSQENMNTDAFAIYAVLFIKIFMHANVSTEDQEALG